MYWITLRSYGITFFSMFIRCRAAFCPRLLAGLALLVGASMAGVGSGQEPPPKSPEPPAPAEESTLIVEQSYSPLVKLDIVPLSWLRFVTGYANFGTGYHSNDARAVIADPNLTALPTARGYEFGVRSKAIPRTELSVTYWVLDLASELVFVGDDGTTEARGPSHRDGIEFAMRLKILDWLTFSGDVTASKAEFDTGGAVLLAPRLTSRADLTARLPWGLSSGLGMRYLGDRYADEGRHQTARGYLLFDFTARYRYKWLEAFVSIENLTNAEYREAQFFFTSRLAGEPASGVPDIHYTPGTPRSVLGGLAVRF